MEIWEKRRRKSRSQIPIPLETMAENAKKPDELIITEDTFHRMNVPIGGSCLLWSIAMSFLLPVKNNRSLFGERFKKLFGLQNVHKTLHAQETIFNHPLTIVYEDETLIELVTKVFQNQVVEEMMKLEEAVHQSVTIDDFIRMKSEGFIIDGSFGKLFETAFPSQTHLVNLSKLKPAQLNKSTIDALNGELDKLSNNDNIQTFMFKAYLKAMGDDKCLIGQREIQAIQKLLHCQIFLFSKMNSTFSINEDNSVKICLFNTNEAHYEFGLVKPIIVIESILKRNYKVASILVKVGVSDVNYLFENNWTLLHFASLSNDCQNIIRSLIWQGADKKQKTINGDTPLQFAEFLGLKKAIAALQSLTSNDTFMRATLPNTPGDHKQLNVESNDENQTSINNKSKTNYLIFSSSNNNIKLLLNIPTQNVAEQTPLPSIIFDKAFHFVLELIDKKICCNKNVFNIRLKDNGNNIIKEFSNWSPLHYAVDKGCLKLVIRFSVNGKADIDVKDHNGGTPLHRAVKIGHLEMLKYLIEIETDINAQDNALRSALSYAATNGYDHIVHYLIETGAEINALDKDGMTPVHLAVKDRRWNAVKCFLEHKADVNIPNSSNKTLLHRLVESDEWNMVKLLLENGAHLMNFSEKQKQNLYKRFISDKVLPFSEAISLGNVELLQILLSKSRKTHSMFKAYYKIKLLNVPLTQDMCMFIEYKLMNDCYFSKNQVDDNAENVKVRIELTSKYIVALETSLMDKKDEIDDIFLFRCKCIAKNMQILKKQLLWTYEFLPWEEMQFYLITFLSSYIEPNQVEDVAYLVMDKAKLMIYLINFKKELEKLNVETKLLKNGMSKTRDKVKFKIISLNPQFKDLYDDFEHLRDVHSLKRIEEYIKISCSVNLNTNPTIGQLAIKRALQVIGECLKSTRHSPNLSNNVRNMLITFAPKNVRNIVTAIRDSLSHAQTLTQIQSMQSNRNHFKEIQNDLIKLQPEMKFISFRKRCVIVKYFLERIISCKNINDICVNLRDLRYENMCKLEGEGNNNKCLIKLSEYLDQLKSLLNNRITPFQAKCLQKIDNFINLKKKSEEIEYNHYEYLSKIKMLIDLIKKNKNLDDIHRLARSILSQFVLANYCDNVKNVRQIFAQCVRLKDSLQNFDEAAEKLLNQILHVIKFEAEVIRNIDQFKLYFNENDSFDFTKQLDDYVLKLIYKMSDNVEVRNKMIKEFEVRRENHKLKNLLINYFNKEISCVEKPNENQFRTWMNKINFKFAREESVLSLYVESDVRKCEKIVQQINRQTEDSYGKLTKTLRKKESTIDFSNKVKNFIKTFKNYCEALESCQIQENAFLKTFLFENYMILENILTPVKSDSDLLCWLRTKDDFRAAIEMITLTITETLDNLNLFEMSCATFLDESIPVLIGKNLRNYLAHGDLLIDVLQIDHLISIIFQIRSIRNKCSKTDLMVYDGNACIGNAKVENVEYLNKNLLKSLQLLEKQQKILNAVKECKMKDLKKLLNNEVEAKYRNANGWSLLFFTAQTDNLEMFNNLFKYCTSVYYLDKLGYSILYYLAKFGSINILKHLIEQKLINSNVTLHDGKSLLHVSAQYGQNEIANLLLTNNVLPNIRDKLQRTPIFLASINNHVDAVSTLIKFGAHIDELHFTDTSLLHYAAMEGCTEVLQLLINNNLVVNHKNKHSHTPLHFACLGGHRNVIEILLKNEAQINAAAYLNLTPLHCAAKEGHEQIVTLLLNNNADVNFLTTEWESALHLATFSGHVKVVKILLEKIFDLNAKTIGGNTPLHYACSSNHYEVAKLLIDNKADVNAVNTEGFTPFHKAAEIGSAEFIEMMLERRADINCAANNGCTPLHLSAQSNTEEVVGLLLKHRANINAHCEVIGTPLHCAMTGQKLDNINLLLANNAIVESDSRGFTPAYIAVEDGYEKGVKALIGKHDINWQFEGNGTLLHMAAVLDNGKIVKLLLENGADVRLFNKNGLNAFHMAIKYVSKKVTKIMLKMNADIKDLKSESGITPLQMASMEGSVDLVKMLIDKGAAVNLAFKDSNNFTALHLAAAMGYFHVVKCLLDYGANANASTIDGFAPLHLLNCPKIFAENKLFPKNNNYSQMEKKVNRIKSAECLINGGAEVNALNKYNRSALHLAAINGLHTTIEILCQNNALLDEKDSANFTPLDYAVLNSDIRCMTYLLQWKDKKKTTFPILSSTKSF